MRFAIARPVVPILLAGALLATGPAAAAPPCTCRHAGQTYQAGELACIRTGSGYRLARCSMSENVSSWRFLKRTCPGIARSGGRPAAGAALLAASDPIARPPDAGSRPTSRAHP